ncbi:Elongation of very long chain fatty acids protein 7 [Cryptotermes secundus]|uniref:Elongation of very long chain fatty acids protein n=2 Tax=Cryptotermes secundus TaxID=105785 RepID=A0A2J7Q2M6_9NEOP|nr:elongation of very long chain fatty acids protein 7 isoform X2 [Cryptotermes secundus]XP_023718149.1 elongation of very long chain fatty acids protein 7 isoform X2 [Cryptotermes secundus]PNF22829.1 Elongation of very long chain fatty acids protein 7 [Cryptotermes secundus]
MAAVIKAGRRAFDEWVIGKMDSRSDDWFLMGSIWHAVAILALYLYFVKHLGPNLMKNRPAFKLEGLMKAYNLLQIITNVYMLLLSLDAAWAFKYKWVCEPVDYSRTPSAYYALKGVWTYLMIKVLDLMDTVFIVLRKKDSQASFLHVYHHGGMFVLAWAATKYLPGGHLTLLGPVNSFVHIVMYTYYFITATWPEFRNKLWWKRHLTEMQMIQFLVIFLHSSLVFTQETCAYPKPFALVHVIQCGVMFFLFLDFYLKTYRKKAS